MLTVDGASASVASVVIAGGSLVASVGLLVVFDGSVVSGVAVVGAGVVVGDLLVVVAGGVVPPPPMGPDGSCVMLVGVGVEVGGTTVLATLTRTLMLMDNGGVPVFGIVVNLMYPS